MRCFVFYLKDRFPGQQMCSQTKTLQHLCFHTFKNVFIILPGLAHWVIVSFHSCHLLTSLHWLLLLFPCTVRGVKQTFDRYATARVKRFLDLTYGDDGDVLRDSWGRRLFVFLLITHLGIKPVGLGCCSEGQLAKCLGRRLTLTRGMCLFDCMKGRKRSDLTVCLCGLENEPSVFLTP